MNARVAAHHQTHSQYATAPAGRPEEIPDLSGSDNPVDEVSRPERFADDGLRIRSKGRGRFGYYIGRIQIKELGYINISQFSVQERNDHVQRSETDRRYKAAAQQARHQRRGLGARA